MTDTINDLSLDEIKQNMFLLKRIAKQISNSSIYNIFWWMIDICHLNILSEHKNKEKEKSWLWGKSVQIKTFDDMIIFFFNFIVIFFLSNITVICEKTLNWVEEELKLRQAPGQELQIWGEMMAPQQRPTERKRMSWTSSFKVSILLNLTAMFLIHQYTP